MSDVPKIVLIGSAYPYRGGLASFNERLIQEYTNQNIKAEIYTFSIQYPSFLFPGKTQYSESEKPNNLVIHRKVNSINPFNWIRIGFELKKMAPELLLFKYWLPFMGPCFGTIARITKKNKKTKVISVLDNIIPHEKRIGDTVLTNYFVTPIDGFVAMSETVKRDLSKFDLTKPRILSFHPLFDNFGAIISKAEAKQRLGLEEEKKYILFFGIVREYKGLDLLLEAFKDERFNDLNLIIAGEFYENPDRYLAKIDSPELKDRIIHHAKFIKDDEVVNYFCAADVVVQPYKHATQSGITQIALHFNKPMIVTDVGGLAELVPNEKVGYVVQPNAKEIAEAIHNYYSLNKESKFVKQIITYKENFTWKEFVENISKIKNQITI